MKLILASSSPRRAEILRDAGIAFQVRAANVEETPLPSENARIMVVRLAESKARAVAESLDPKVSAIVIGADTAVELDGKIFGKPRDTEDAYRMIASLSGRTHKVLTGICAMRLPDKIAKSAVETTAVTFAALAQPEIESYVASGEPFDKAGGYAIQGRAGRFIPRIEGCYFNVVGLPLARLYPLLRELGWEGDGPP
jgi:nucleoside triphosphate pyrophosphatase